MANGQTQAQNNPFGGGIMENIFYALLGGGLLPALTKDPTMGPWGMVGGAILPELQRWLTPEEEEVNPFENLNPPNLTEDTWRQGFMTSPQTGQRFLDQLNPQLYAPFQMATEQTANQNRMATENYNRWAQATEGAYQNAADILAARSGMYHRGSN